MIPFNNVNSPIYFIIHTDIYDYVLNSLIVVYNFSRDLFKFFDKFCCSLSAFVNFASDLFKFFDKFSCNMSAFVNFASDLLNVLTSKAAT